MLSYVLFSHAASDFPIHTLRLLLSLLNSHSAHLLHPSSPASQLILSLASLLSFPVVQDTCPETPVARVTQALSTKLST